MTSESVSTDKIVEKKEPIFKELNADEDPEVTEIESLCLRCHNNGITKVLLTKIPFYKEVVIMSFLCNSCNWENNELQPAGKIQEKGILYTLKIQNAKDLGRVVVKTEWASVVIPELEFEIPSQSQDGMVTTVEGIIERSYAGLNYKIEHLRENDGESVTKITEFLTRLSDLKEGNTPFTFVLRDISGNSFLESICAPDPDPQLEVNYFERTPEECLKLGMYSLDVDDKENDDSQNEEDKDLKDEVLGLPTNCYACNAPCVTNMKIINIPHFKDIVIMVTICEVCGHKTNEVKSCCGIQPLGIKMTLLIENAEDLKRDVLKSDTCKIYIKELELEVGAAAFGSRYSTVEGILCTIKDQLKEKNPFVTGDSADPFLKEKMGLFLKKIDEILAGERKVTLVLDDPCGNSYLQSIDYPNPDKNMVVEHYERSVEQNEDLGLLDMKVENYEDS